MRLDIVTPSEMGEDEGNSMVAVSHLNECIYWNMLSRTINNAKEEEMGSNIFEPLNQFLNSLDQNKQSQMFEMYRQVHQVFQSIMHSGNDDVEMIARKIRPIMGKLFSLVPENDILNWTWYTLVPGFPVDIRDAFTSDMPGSPERTYLTDDYRKLIPMAIIVRLAFPIITEFTHTARDELGKLHKESAAFTLLHNTWVYNSEAMKRLYVFVDHTVGSDKENDNAIMSGIGSQNFIEWVLSFLVIKRLMKVDVKGNSSPSVVSSLYNAIDTRVKQIITGGRNIKIKKEQKDSGNDPESNHSFLESFRTKEEITTGDLTIFREYVSRQINIALTAPVYPSHSLIARIDPTIPQSLIKDCYHVQLKRKNYEYKPIQIILVMWLFSDYISPRIAPHLNKGNLIALIAIAQAYFVNRKMYDFSILAGASYRLNINDAERPISEGASAIPKQTMANFINIFPFYKRGGFDGGTSRTLTLLPQATIDEYVHSLKSYEIVPALNRNIINALGVPTVPSIYTPPKTIRIKIAEFLMELATTPKKSINWDTLAVEEGFNPSKASY